MNLPTDDLSKNIIKYIMRDLKEPCNWIQFNNDVLVEESELGKRWIRQISKDISNYIYTSRVESIDMSGEFEGFFDGSAKPNPGIIKIGGFIKDATGKIVFQYSEEKGHGTNNEAEYMSFIRLINEVVYLGIKNIKIYGDSALVVNQVNRTWKAKDERMKAYRTKALYLLHYIHEWRLKHIKRGLNTEADLLTR